MREVDEKQEISLLWPNLTFHFNFIVVEPA